MKLAALQQLLFYAKETYGDIDIEAIKLGSFDVPPFMFATTSASITTNGNLVLEFHPKQGT